MTLVSNDPGWWPAINANLITSYFIVAACTAVMYDWVLTFGKEVELVWKQRWFLITVLYLVARYVAIGYVVMNVLLIVPTISTTDAGCLIIYNVFTWMGEAVNAILGAIMIIRLHAMYQRSRKVLMFLVAVFLVIRIASAVIIEIMTVRVSAEELFLSGTHQCTINYAGDPIFLFYMTWILSAVWEVLALCLAVWIAVKHFRELRRNSRAGLVRNCLTVLIQTHVSYFASFLAASCFQIGFFSSTLSIDIYSLDTPIYIGFAQIFEIAQLSVLGPRLILSVRENNAKLVADSDTTSAMTSIVVHVETRSSV